MLICDFCIDILVFVTMHTLGIGGIISFDYYNHLTARLVHGEMLNDFAYSTPHGLPT